MLNSIEQAASFENTNLIVRSPCAIAEVKGPLGFHRGRSWLRLGEEGSSHIHVKVAAISRVEFVAPTESNAALKVLDTEGVLLCRIVFRHTNPSATPFDETRRTEVIQAFQSKPA